MGSWSLAFAQIAVPLRDRHGKVVAVLGASAHSTSIGSRAMTRDHLVHLKAAAEEAALLVR